MIANNKYITEAKDILFYMERLEYSTAKTIEEFMVKEICLDWEKNAVWKELAETLKATMVLLNGWWVSK